jgi:1,4-dihydroxy-2-naphthoate octaprenyltransferase
MKRAMILTFFLAFLVGLYLVYRGGWPILIIGLLSILFGVLYTGGPYPLGYLGLGDVFVLVFFGPIAVAGTYYVQALTVTPESIIAGLAPGLFSTAILAINNLRDAEGDAKTGKRTLAVRFGKTFARFEYVMALLLGGVAVPVSLCLLTGSHWWALLACISLLPAIPAIKTAFTQDGAALNAVLANTGKFLLLYSVLFSVGWLL